MKALDRTKVLQITLLILVLFYIAKNELFDKTKVESQPFQTLNISNEFEVGSVDVKTYSTSLNVSYSYNGELGESASLIIMPVFDNPKDIIKSDRVNTQRRIKPGTHKDSYFLKNPCNGLSKCEASSIRVKMVDSKQYYDFNRTGKNLENLPAIYDQTFDIRIHWNVRTEQVRELTKEDDLKLAIWYLDRGNREYLKRAKKILDKLTLSDPKNIQIYNELARYHMKSSWNTVGLRKAEEVLDAAVSLDDSYANSYVLRGYVYTHQKKYDAALADFKTAKKLGTDNLWLMTNWGEFYELQEEYEHAKNFYMKSINAERKKPSPNDRAKISAFDRLINLSTKEESYNLVDDLLKKKTVQFPKNGCFHSERARFQLLIQGKISDSLPLAEKGITLKCNKHKFANQVYSDALLLESYRKKSAGQDGSIEYIKALSLDSDWPTRIYRFSSHNKTLPALRNVLKNNIDIDEVDKYGYSALALATTRNDVTSVKNLLKLGANPNKSLDEGYNIFLLALISSDAETIKAFLESGVKLNQKFENGVTPKEILKERGFKELLNQFNKSV